METWNKGRREKLIPFTEEDVKGYLDRCIKYWRTQEDKDYHVFYIDAFQSVRKTLFGEILMPFDSPPDN